MSEFATKEDYKKVLEAILRDRPSVIQSLNVEQQHLAGVLLELGYSPDAFNVTYIIPSCNFYTD